jgi:hypothetical protein
LLARAFLAFESAWSAATTALHSAVLGVFLGLMGRDAIARLDALYYDAAREPVPGDAAAGYVDRTWVQRGPFDWEREAVHGHFSPGSRIAVTSAGSGREVLWLRELGYDAHGYEPNAQLVDAGAALLAGLGHPGRLARCEPDVLPAVGPDCDGVVVGWTGYMHIQGRDRRLAFLRAAASRSSAGTCSSRTSRTGSSTRRSAASSARPASRSSTWPGRATHTR